ncbi:MAG: hypothetical protein ACU837_02955 [Gammaproteobacteria bacterium]
MNNVLLAGIPRSGTTLTCSLLNRLDNAVALSEPMLLEVFSEHSPELWAPEIDRYCRDNRARLLQQQTVWLRDHRDGNFFTAQCNDAGLRVRTYGERVQYAHEGRLDDDFMLLIKHPNAFTAMLPVLKAHFRCFATIRNPLAVLASWNSIDLNVRRGTAPQAERFYPPLRERLAQITATGAKQLALLSWYYEMFAEHLPPENILSYEQLIVSRGRSLQAITPAARQLDEPLSDKNLNALYDYVAMRDLGALLLDSEGGYWHFYDKSSIEALLHAVSKIVR